MLDIVSVQRGNILGWFLNDAVIVAAARIHVAESSARQMKSYRYRKHKYTSLLSCQKKINLENTSKWFHEKEVSINYAV